jgi:hypothetical protein
MIKRSNLQIWGVEEGTEIQTKGTENLFNKIITESFPNPGKYMDIKSVELFRAPNRHDYKRISPHQMIVKMLRI